MADITRNQFNESKNVTKKIFQSGHRLLDSDVNEQVDINLRQFRRLLSCIGNHTSIRFGDGFNVIGDGSTLEVTIKAGFGIFQIGTKIGALIQLDADYTLSGFTAWASNRTDYIYVDIWEEEIDASEDPNIVNPDYGSETCVDQRINFTFNISEGSAPGSPPANHTYITLATVTKTSGSTIAQGDITMVMEKYLVLEDDSILNSMIHSNVAGTGLAQDTDGSLKIDTDGVQTANIADQAVTMPKLNDSMLGRYIDKDTGINKLEVLGISETLNGVRIRARRIPFAWDMDAQATIDVSHGIPDFVGATGDPERLCLVHVMVHDASDIVYPLNYIDSGAVQGWWNINGSTITLHRLAGGFFDDPAFSSYNGILFVMYWES